MEYKCNFCDRICKKYGVKSHELYCKLNPNKKTKVGSNNPNFGNKGHNHYTKAKELGLPKPLVSDATREKISKASKAKVWTEEKREKHSRAMKKAVLENPESYSANNVSGRAKIIEYKGFNLKGSWELKFAQYLDSLDIKWSNKIEPFEYLWNNKIHLYFPYFYLSDFNFYVEVKGYQRDRDLAKWKVIDKLIIIKENEMKLITKNNFDLISLLK